MPQSKRSDMERIYKQLKEASYLIWQSPQSFGQKHVVDWSDVEHIFKKFLEE